MSCKTFIADFLVFVVVSCLNLVSGDNCSPPETILPCTCEFPDSPLLECSNITKPETIIDIVEKTGGMKFRKLALVFSSLMYLPTSAIISEKFQELMVANSTFVSLFDKPPSTQNSLKFMFLSNVHITRGVQWEMFQNFRKLEELAFLQTDVTTLGKDFQNNISPSITSLHMVQTNTNKIVSGAFGKLKSMSVLHIRNSKIKVLKRSMFAKPTVLKTLNFQSNHIEFLPDDLFSDMPHLKEIVLTNNRISIIKKETFNEILSQLQTLVVDGNPINCSCDFAWIVKAKRSNIQGVCQQPEFRKGKTISGLAEKDFEFCF